ncbi:MAG: amidohydrolase family protein [Spirochaetales bacterium]|nr:amidohydrolase family protein [Spirochaetales bacterium]
MRPNRYIVGGGTLYDGTTFLKDGAILIDDGEIAALGPTDPIRTHHDAPFVDVSGRLILPGLLDAHTHLYSALAAGLQPAGPMDTFGEILANLWWRLDAVHDEESIYFSAMAGVIEHIKAGVTTIFDHHASMGLVAGSLDIVERAFREAGIRGTLCFETSERTGREAVADHIEENVEFYESHRTDSFVRGTMGLHANLTLSGESLSEIAAARPIDMPIHVHVGEAHEDLALCEREGYEGPVDRLHRYGLVDSNALLIHALHLSKRDAAILREVQPIVVTAPQSNWNNGVGSMDPSMVRKYALGTDGMTGDVIETLRFQFLSLQAQGADLAPLQEALFSYRREIQKHYFPATGDFAVGSRADIAVLDYIPITPVDDSNVLPHLIYGMKRGVAFMTIVDGRVLYEDGRLTFLDEDRFQAHASKVAHRLHERFDG